MPPKRMTANPIRPSRHRAGKPIAEEQSSDSEESSEEEVQEQKPKAPPPKATSFPSTAKKITSDLKSVNLNTQQQRAEAAARSKEAAGTAIDEDEFVTESESGSGSGSEEEDGDSSEEEDSSTDEEIRRKKLLRPVFIKKSQRINPAEAEQKALEDRQAQEEARRREAADALVQEQLDKEAQARAAGKKQWDDDEPDEATAEAVDDTDDVDPAAEYLAWKLRELKRIKRDRVAIEQAEEERAEIERRRNLTAAEREAEDSKYIQNQRDERGANKGQMSYMQKYFHKGAFFQDDLKEAGLDRRDIMGSRFEDATNREILPEYMQIRDMTKLGRKGRTKYKDMKSEDTGRWGDFGGDRRGGGGAGAGGPRGNGGDRGEFVRDERYKRDYDNDRGGRGGEGAGGTGANSKPLGERKRAGDEYDRDREGKRVRND